MDSWLTLPKGLIGPKGQFPTLANLTNTPAIRAMAFITALARPQSRHSEGHLLATMFRLSGRERRRTERASYPPLPPPAAPQGSQTPPIGNLRGPAGGALIGHALTHPPPLFGASRLLGTFILVMCLSAPSRAA